MVVCFNNIFLALFMLFFGLTSAHAQNESAPQKNLPATIGPDLDEFEKEIKRAYQEYLRSAEKARKKAVVALQRDLKSSMKLNDLETSVEIKNAIDKLEDTDLWIAGKPANTVVADGNEPHSPKIASAKHAIRNRERLLDDLERKIRSGHIR